MAFQENFSLNRKKKPNLSLSLLSTRFIYPYKWRFLKKLKMQLLYDSAIPLLGIYLENNMIRKDMCTPMFIAAVSNSQDMAAI